MQENSLFFLFFLFSSINLTVSFDLSILKEQIKSHPNQTLQDVYKSCYQDEYGPGHLIPNKTTCYQNLINELSSLPPSYSPITIFESTGTRGDFIRVDLLMVAKGHLPLQILFDSLLISAEIGARKSDENWDKIWAEIVTEIEKEGLQKMLVGFEEDKVRLEAISKNEDKVVHHSEMYEKTYDPHYRIIERKIFVEYVYPFIRE